METVECPYCSAKHEHGPQAGHHEASCEISITSTKQNQNKMNTNSKVIEAGNVDPSQAQQAVMNAAMDAVNQAERKANDTGDVAYAAVVVKASGDGASTTTTTTTTPSNESMAQNTLDQAGNMVQGGWNAAQNMVGSAQQAVVNTVQSVGEQAKNLAGSALEKAHETIQPVVDFTQDKLSSSATTTTEPAPDTKFQETRSALEHMRAMAEERGLTPVSAPSSSDMSTPEKLYDPVDFSTKSC
jgi:hypothetical protein